MVVERARNIPTGVLLRDFSERPNLAFENERQTIEKSVGIALTSIILSHLTIGSLATILRNPSKLLSNLVSYPKLQTLNKLKSPEDDVKLFTELFASALTKSWTVTDTKNISEKEKDLVFYCAELRNKAYGLKTIMQEVCKHFNLSLTEALEIAKKEYFTIADLAQELKINIGNAQNRVAEILKKDRTIKPERFGGKGGPLFILESQRNKLKLIIESLIQTAIVTLPDNSLAIIKGKLKKKIFDMLLPTFNQPHGLTLDKILDLYQDGPNAKVNANHVMAALKKELQAFGWTIENKHIKKGLPRQKHISEYFLRRYQAPEISPVTSIEKEEVTIFEPKFDSRVYSTPKGEHKSWWKERRN